MAFILIGAPVYKREWILPLWFDRIEKQDWPLSDIGFVFEGAPDDQGTMEVLNDFAARHPEVQTFDVTVNQMEQHVTHPPNGRYWNADRYHKMVRLRNNLLAKAQAFQPDRYFSLDTDILLDPPDTLSKLFELTSRLDAVSPLMYMTPDNTEYPSVMTWIDQTNRAGRRPDYPIGTLFQADVIMAAKMMSPKVYNNSQYIWHSQGEDLGWSTVCRQMGFKLYSASYLYCPHIMGDQMLEAYLAHGSADQRFVNSSVHV